METRKQLLDLVAKYQKLVTQPSRELFDEVFSYAHPCNLIAITNRFESRERIYNDFLMGALKKAYSRIELIADEISVNVISEELAIVIFWYHTECDLRESGEPFGFSGIETQVMINEKGQWRIIHIHYSKP